MELRIIASLVPTARADRKIKAPTDEMIMNDRITVALHERQSINPANLKIKASLMVGSGVHFLVDADTDSVGDKKGGRSDQSLMLVNK